MPPEGTAAASPAAAAAKAAGRAAFVASAAARAQAEPAAPPASAADLRPAAAVEEAPEADEPDADAAPEDDAAPEAAPPPKEEKPAADPAVAQRLAAAQKAERAKHERIAKERAEAESIRAAAAKEKAEAEALRKEIEADRAAIEEARRYKALRERAKVDPDAAIELLGLDAGAYDELTRLAYSQTEAGAKDPKAKEHAARLMRERAARGEVGGVKSELAKMQELITKQNERIEQMTREQGNQSVINDYLDTIEEAFGEAHPVASRALTAARAKANDRTIPAAERQEAKRNMKAMRDEFARVAEDLYVRDKVPPEPEEVAAEVEIRRVAELRRLGYDPAAVTPAAPAPKKQGTPPPTVLARAGGGPTQPPRKLTPAELREQFIRQKAAGKLDD